MWEFLFETVAPMFPEDTVKYSCQRAVIVYKTSIQAPDSLSRKLARRSQHKKGGGLTPIAMPMLDNRVWALATALPSSPRVKGSKPGLRQQCYKYWLASLFIDSPTRY